MEPILVPTGGEARGPRRTRGEPGEPETDERVHPVFLEVKGQ